MFVVTLQLWNLRFFPLTPDVVANLLYST